MSGHSKWAQIKRQKGVADVKRGAVFTKLAREITVAARSGGGDPEMNPRLRLVLQHARAENMPNDNVQRAIKRGIGEGDEAIELHEITYEAYGPGGTALLVQALTDNRNRTVAEVRAALTRAGGALGETGSVMWNFDSKGLITVEADGVDPDEVTLLAIDAGADDVEVEEDSIEIYTQPEDLEDVRQQLEGAVPIAAAEMVMKPKSTVPLSDEDTAKALRLLDRLDELDDVQKVYTNAEFADAALAAYSA